MIFACVELVVAAGLRPREVLGVNVPPEQQASTEVLILRELRGSLVAPVVCYACVNGVTMTVVVLVTG